MHKTSKVFKHNAIGIFLDMCFLSKWFIVKTVETRVFICKTSLISQQLLSHVTGPMQATVCLKK